MVFIIFCNLRSSFLWRKYFWSCVSFSWKYLLNGVRFWYSLSFCCCRRWLFWFNKRAFCLRSINWALIILNKLTCYDRLFFCSRWSTFHTRVEIILLLFFLCIGTWLWWSNISIYLWVNYILYDSRSINS